MTDLFSITTSDVLVMGVGTLGGRIAAAGAEGSARAIWTAANVDAAALLATGLEHKLLLRCDAAVGSPFAARALQRSIAERIGGVRALCSGRKLVLLVGAIDEAHSGVAMAELAFAFASQGMVVCALALSGCEFDRAHRNANEQEVQEVLETLQAQVPVCIHIPAAQLLNGASKDQPLSNLQSDLEKRILLIAETLSSVFANGSANGFGAFDFVNALHGSGSLIVGIGIVSDRSPLIAVALALQDAGAVGDANGVAAAIITSEELTAGQAIEIQESIRSHIALNATDALLFGHATHTLGGGEACCVVLARQARSRNLAIQNR